MNQKRNNILQPAPAAVFFLLVFLAAIVMTHQNLSAVQSLSPIISNGKSACVIATAPSAGETELYAAAELQSYLSQITGAELKILPESDAAGKCAILVGDTVRGKEIISDTEKTGLGAEGFIIREKGGDIAIRGSSPRGTLYGVYALLEDHLGVRWLAPDTTVVPEKTTIDLTGLKETQKPSMEYREAYFYEAFNGDWAARNRLNGHSHNLSARHGGSVNYKGFVHTMFSFVPPDKYFASHPEYFSEIEGKRVPDAQLCLTNPDVLKIVKERVTELAESAKGETVIISVSQNDNMRPCRCAKCLAVDKEEGSQAGSLIRFVNEVADSVAVKYPNVAIDTLAYQYTEKAPLKAKPRPNVIVRLCHMAPSCDIHSLKRCILNAAYVKNLKAWARISNRVYVWHYVTDFWAYMAPLPDLDPIRLDIPFYSKNSVKGLFAQGNGESPGAEMAELKSWLIAKLLWNPDADSEKLIKDFIDGYYGPAAPAMSDYINMQRENAKSYKIHANLYSPPDTGFINSDLLYKMGLSLDSAEKLAAGDKLYSEHVRLARLKYDYLKLAAPRLFVSPDGKKLSSKELLTLFDKFKGELHYFNITKLKEWEPIDKSLQNLRLKIYGWK